MLPYGRKHSECAHYKDGFCNLHRINVNPDSPACPYFTPKEEAGPTRPPWGYTPPITMLPLSQYPMPYPYYPLPPQYYWGYPQMLWNSLYSLWYLQMYLNSLLSYYLMLSPYSWFALFWLPPWYLYSW